MAAKRVTGKTTPAAPASVPPAPSASESSLNFKFEVCHIEPLKEILRYIYIYVYV